MRILISNDDGIAAPGLRALVSALHDVGQVVVVAPDDQRSASSHAMSLHRRLYVERHDMGLPGVEAWAVSGTPVDCVKWGIVQLGQPGFDLMLSGINQGQNLATDVLYSGTVGAAGEAALQHIPAVALSLVGPQYPFDEAAQVAKRIAGWVTTLSLPPDTFLSVNMPGNGLSTAPWVVTELGARGYTNHFYRRVDPDGREYYRYTGEELEESGGESTDVKALQRGEISITPIRYRFTHMEQIDDLAQRLNQTSHR